MADRQCTAFAPQAVSVCVCVSPAPGLGKAHPSTLKHPAYSESPQTNLRPPLASLLSGPEFVDPAQPRL